MKVSNVIRSLFVTLVGAIGCGPASTFDGTEVAASQEAFTVMPGDRAFATSSNLTGIAQANPSQSYSSAGGVIWVHHLGIVGRYRVDIPNLGSTGGGHVQVTSTSNNDFRCKVRNWGSLGATLQIFVDCTTGQGLPADSLFTLNYVRRTDTPGPEGAYVWAFDPYASSYNATSAYSWNSTGQGIYISHTLNSGSYSIMLPGQDLNGGTVQVTAYGSGNAHCKIKDWNSGSINVNCFDGYNALPKDSPFTMLFSRKSPNGTASFSYLWASQPGESYRPDVSRRLALVDVASWTQQSAVLGSPFIQAISNGDHVTFPYMAANSASPSNVMVTAYGSGTATCKAVGWGQTTGSDAAAIVSCFAQNGWGVYSRYTVTYSSLAWVP